MPRLPCLVINTAIGNFFRTVDHKEGIELRALFLYLAAAVLEIGGCFAFWVWLREGKSWAWAAAGATALMSFAWILTQIPSDFAGRTFAAYGGVYICCSLAWLWRIEGQRPDLWDALGAGCCFVGAGLILFGPRS